MTARRTSLGPEFSNGGEGTPPNALSSRESKVLLEVTEKYRDTRQIAKSSMLDMISTYQALLRLNRLNLIEKASPGRGSRPAQWRKPAKPAPHANGTSVEYIPRDQHEALVVRLRGVLATKERQMGTLAAGWKIADDHRIFAEAERDTARAETAAIEATVIGLIADHYKAAIEGDVPSIPIAMQHYMAMDFPSPAEASATLAQMLAEARAETAEQCARLLDRQVENITEPYGKVLMRTYAAAIRRQIAAADALSPTRVDDRVGDDAGGEGER